MAAGVGWWIAHVAFWVLLAIGWAFGDVRVRGTIVLLMLWTAGYLASRSVTAGAELFFSFVALLDIVLVFVVFKSDVRL